LKERKKTKEKKKKKKKKKKIDNLKYNHEELFPFLRYSINNLGDPYRKSNYAVESRPFELEVRLFPLLFCAEVFLGEVVNYFAGLWNLPVEDAWGYVTCSGTEGNMHAMIVARECLPSAPVYFSSQTHYSIAKSAGFYRMEV
jgi:histidine decarboxylase